jgi:hypothetical protein
MTDVAATVRRVVEAGDWNERVEAIRRIPEQHGQREHSQAYAAVAGALYRPHLSPQFAFVQWRDEYAAETFAHAYRLAVEQTDSFRRVDSESLQEVLRRSPEVLLVLRTIVGYTANELAAAVDEVAAETGRRGITGSRVKSIEQGSRPSEEQARICAETISRLVDGDLWGDAPDGFRSKIEKPDTIDGWASVRRLAADGVPYDSFLHQRHYGGAFRTLLDATGVRRGDLIEAAVGELLIGAGVPFLQTGSAHQREIASRFNLTVRPAPDFVIYEPPAYIRGIIECKQANDGGTARDKAARYGRLRAEAIRLGGIALFAVVDGLGWERLNDALGPVVRDCDGRVFTLKSLPEMLEVHPLPTLRGKVAQPE